MALIDVDAWIATSGNVVTGADRTAVEAHCAAVSAALTRRIYPNVGEPVTLTLFAMDAPKGSELTLPIRPCRTLSALYLAWGASGDPSKATADTLLTQFTDYWMPVDPVTGFSRSGLVHRRGSSSWAVEYRRPPGRLGYSMGAARGAIFVSGSFGFASVPADLQEAAARAVTLLYQRRKTGMALTSESWGGYSAGYAGPFTATGAVASPEVTDLLRAGGYLPIHTA